MNKGEPSSKKLVSPEAWKNQKEIMEKEMNSYDVSVLEERIKVIITKIREARSRLCYQNILDFINRNSDKKISIDSLKLVIEDLLE